LVRVHDRLCHRHPANRPIPGLRPFQRQEALEVRRRVLGEEHPDALTALNSLAVVARDQGRLDEARAMGERVLHLRARVLGDTHPSTVESMRDLAETLKRLGDPESALDLLTRASDIQAEQLAVYVEMFAKFNQILACRRF
jgi:tetratricopeptide (TPR) repeat protein